MPKPVRFKKEILDAFTCPEGENDAYLKDSGQAAPPVARAAET